MGRASLATGHFLVMKIAGLLFGAAPRSWPA
jgi:hypothetical protein